MYKTAFQSPKGAKLIKHSIIEIMEHCLSTIKEHDLLVTRCEDCPLKYIRVSEDGLGPLYCLLLDHIVINSVGFIINDPKCTTDDHEKYIVDLIKRAYE